MKIVPVQLEHIDGVVEVFCLAFEESINFFTPVNEKLKGFFNEAFILLYKIFERGFVVVQEDNLVWGYIVMVDDVKKLWTGAISSGFLFKAGTRLIKGEYGLDLNTLYKIVKNKLFYLKFEMSTIPSAQLLSIAVHPKHHGKGIGQKLLSHGIKYIESLGIKRIKLEARPENISAVRLYQKNGFNIIGETQDLQGKWLIMVRDIG